MPDGVITVRTPFLLIATTPVTGRCPPGLISLVAALASFVRSKWMTQKVLTAIE
jgi:hypothetical protein